MGAAAKMNGLDILNILPEIVLWIVLLVLGVIAFFVIWVIWGSYFAPASKGVNMGYYTILGGYAGGRLHKEISGLLVDATHRFLTYNIEREFKETLKGDMQNVIDTGILDAKEKAGLTEMIKQLDKFEFSDNFRIIVTREKMTKHLFVQWGQTEPLSQYATVEEEHRFAFGLGPVSQGVIAGWLVTVPQKWDIIHIGKCTLHAFLPVNLVAQVGAIDNPDPVKRLKEISPDWMPKLIPHMRSTVESKKMVQAVEDQLAAKGKEIENTLTKLTETQTELDQYKRMTAAFGLEDSDIKELLQGRAIDMVDFILLALPVFLGSYIAEVLELGLLVGVFVGLLIGFAGVHRRRKRGRS